MAEQLTPKLPDIDSIDIYLNPHSSYANHGGAKEESRQLAEAFQVDPTAITIIDEQPTPELIAERHKDRRSGLRLSVLKGGDGSIEDWVTSAQEYLRTVQPSDFSAENTPLLGLSGMGNALNVPTSVNGIRYARNLSKLLLSGNAGVSLWHPVLCRMPNGEERSVTSIMGLVGTAAVNAALEARREELRSDPKLVRLGKESLETFKQYRNLDLRFSVLSSKLKHLHRAGQTLAGLDIITMTDIIKVGHVPIDLFSDEIFIMQTYLSHEKAGRVADTAVNGMRLAIGKPVGTNAILRPGESFTITIDRANGPIPSQVDGDPWTTLQPGESVEFSRSKIGIPVICNQKKLAG